MKTYRFTADAKANEAVAPTAKKGINVFDFSYYTLCAIADATHYTYPTPETMALYCQHTTNGDVVLTLDDMGNFMSLTPAL